MGDEYISQMIVDELERSCPGEAGCHGCQSWCPKCGSVGHVCDDPECDTHRRKTDVLYDMRGAEKVMAGIAASVQFMEEMILEHEKAIPPPRNDWERGEDRERRTLLRMHIGAYQQAEKEMAELLDELDEITKGSRLVPRNQAWKDRKQPEPKKTG